MTDICLVTLVHPFIEETPCCSLFDERTSPLNVYLQQKEQQGKQRAGLPGCRADDVDPAGSRKHKATRPSFSLLNNHSTSLSDPRTRCSVLSSIANPFQALSSCVCFLLHFFMSYSHLLTIPLRRSLLASVKPRSLDAFRPLHYSSVNMSGISKACCS